MLNKKDNFAIYGMVISHLLLTLLLPLLCLIFILTMSDFWVGIGWGGFFVLVIKGSSEFTRWAIVIYE